MSDFKDTGSLFERRPDLYDAMVDWDRRLGNEGPFYLRLFERIGARKLLDAACGTGRHAALFHSWGLTVEGADLSEAMIEKCRALHGEHDTLHWRLRPFEQPADERNFDVAICVGNSLGGVDDLGAASRAIAAILGNVHPCGACVLHVLNIWRFEEGPTTWQKCRRISVDGEERVLLKGVHRTGDDVYIDLVELDVTSEEIRSWTKSSRLLGYEAEFLSQAAKAAGAADVRLLGDYKETPYDRESSVDIILVATKA